MKKKIFYALFFGILLVLFSSEQVTYAQKVKPTNNQLHQAVKKMSLAEKIGQMYISPSPADVSKTNNDISKYHLGGLVLFGNDFKNQNATQLKQKLTSFQSSAKIPLFIATDQEGGTVSRLSTDPQLTNGRYFPSPQETYNQQGLAGTIAEASKTAKIMHNLGINWNFAPVADVSNDPKSFIYPRTLGQNYQTTATYISKVVPAIQKQHVVASLKHFPGYGSAADTHTGFASTDRSLADFQKNDFLPFEAGIKKNVSTVLVAHVVMKSVDSQLPASLSPKVHQLLRKKLKFKGVIITDDLGMGAITKYSQEHKVTPDVLAVKAGNDALLSNNYVQGIPAIEQAVRTGSIKEKQINASVYRILKIKRNLGLLKIQQLK
ncbi:glycoside hydrolase family 3 N-terminal domain-containing protein [Liquorilactobacillus uvarum]|uniref:glycoside hydrolase family 3 N-terminal domain-containing protein n=1 Tax=Liquorilactobacillus uvarum TaxID=303240 RepID=UPI00288C10B0|nr:glycoside hydrolase family 3 N-terminal domain-containing protein [Liquorilactobacillus uvarum]